VRWRRWGEKWVHVRKACSLCYLCAKKISQSVDILTKFWQKISLHSIFGDTVYTNAVITMSFCACSLVTWYLLQPSTKYCSVFCNIRPVILLLFADASIPDNGGSRIFSVWSMGRMTYRPIGDGRWSPIPGRLCASYKVPTAGSGPEPHAAANGFWTFYMQLRLCNRVWVHYGLETGWQV